MLIGPRPFMRAFRDGGTKNGSKHPVHMTNMASMPIYGKTFNKKAMRP